MMGVVVNGPWPMSQTLSIQNEIVGEKSFNSATTTAAATAAGGGTSSSLSSSSTNSGTGTTTTSTTTSSLTNPWLRKMKLVKRIKRKIGLGTRGGESSPNNLPPLTFHPVHGENVQLFNDGTIAKRFNSFCNAITFSNRVVKVNERINIKLIEISQDWRGVLRFGFTNVDPASMTSLPAYTIPNLTSKSGYWAKTFDESDTRFTGLNFKKDSILYYYVNQAGNVHFGINGEDKGVFFYGVDTRKPLWALIDVYGCTTGLEMIDTRTRLNNSRKSLNESVGGGFSGSRPCSRNSKQQASNELELKIISSMGSMNLRSDEAYQYGRGDYPSLHHPHCRQRSLSCCQHYSEKQQQYQNHRFENDSDEDLFQKPQKIGEQQFKTPLPEIDCSSSVVCKKKLSQFDEPDEKELVVVNSKLNHYPYSESQLEIVCRRASLSPASFNLFNNKSIITTANNNNELNHLHDSEQLKTTSPKIISKNNTVNNNNLANAKANNNHNIVKPNNNSNNISNISINKGINKTFVETVVTTNVEPNSISHQRHQSMYHYNTNSNNNHNNVNNNPLISNKKQGATTPECESPPLKMASNTTTWSSPLLPKMKSNNNNRYSYHGGKTNIAIDDDEFFEQQLLLAAATSSPVSPASSSSSYVVVRGNNASQEPLYTEIINSGPLSYTSYFGGSPVIQRSNSQIGPVYSATTFPTIPMPTTPPSMKPKAVAEQQQPSSKSAPSTPSSKKPQWSVGCVSCYERPVNSIFHACGHMCMCYQCAFEYWTNKERATCPICSTIISDVVIRSSINKP